MISRSVFVPAIVGVVAAAAFAVWLLEPHVDRLSVTLGVGFLERAPTSETTRFAADLERFLRPVDFSVVIALLVILAGGLPLAAISLIARHWPWLFGRLSRNATAIWICLTLQLTNLLLSSFFILSSLFILLFAVDEPDAEILTVTVIALLYGAFNLAATWVWRDLLNRLHLSRLARATSATS